jgi:hypothetical protein
MGRQEEPGPVILESYLFATSDRTELYLGSLKFCNTVMVFRKYNSLIESYDNDA